MTKKKPAKPSRNKRREARLLKHEGRSKALASPAPRAPSTPTSRVREQCEFCGREGGQRDPDKCNPQSPCTQPASEAL